MLLSSSFASCLIGFIFVGTIFLFAKIWSKRNKEAAMGGVTGMLIGFVLVFLLIMLRQHVYVVHGPNDYTHYVAYGPSSYTTNNGKQIALSGSILNGMVINESQQRLVLEEVVYGIAFAEAFDIEPNTEYEFNESYINYLFADTPPEEISSQSEDPVIHLWLHLKD